MVVDGALWTIERLIALVSSVIVLDISKSVENCTILLMRFL